MDSSKRRLNIIAENMEIDAIKTGFRNAEEPRVET